MADSLDRLESVVKRAHSIEGMMEAIHENIHGPRPPATTPPGPPTPTPDRAFVYLHERLQAAENELTNSLDRIAKQAEELISYTDNGRGLN